MIGGRTIRMVSGVAVGFAVLANLFLFLPMTLFVGNEKEFSVPFNSILLTYSAPVLAILVAIALISFLLPAKWFRMFAALLGVVALLTWLQGNLFVWDYGLLNGSSIAWDKNRIRGWFELAIWLFAISFVVWRVQKVGESVVGIAITLGALQLGLFGFNYLNSAEELGKGIDVEKEIVAASKIHQYSKADNIVHIIADGFQADVLAEILTTGESGKQLSRGLTGFSVFRKHLGAFPYTHMSVPAILTGQVYRNQQPIDEFMSSSLGENSIISLAKQHGYEIDLGIPRGALMDVYQNTNPDYVFPVTGGAQLKHAELVKKDAARLFDLSLFRSVPHHLKMLVQNDHEWLTQSWYSEIGSGASQNFMHMEFLNESAKRISVDRDTKVYKLFHLMLSHNPMVTTRDCRYAGRVLPTIRENVISQARCGLQEIITLLEAMKKSGIYESSTIIVMGDHGAWVPPNGAKGILNVENSTIESIIPSMTALATPFYAIKRPGDSGAIKFSDVPSSITDTAKTIATIKEFENEFDGTSVFSLSDEQRDRRFSYYQYSMNEWRENRLSPIEEFSITGDPVDSGSWTPVSIHLPSGEKEPAKIKSRLWRAVAVDDQ